VTTDFQGISQQFPNGASSLRIPTHHYNKNKSENWRFMSDLGSNPMKMSRNRLKTLTIKNQNPDQSGPRHQLFSWGPFSLTCFRVNRGRLELHVNNWFLGPLVGFRQGSLCDSNPNLASSLIPKKSGGIS